MQLIIHLGTFHNLLHLPVRFFHKVEGPRDDFDELYPLWHTNLGLICDDVTCRFVHVSILRLSATALVPISILQVWRVLKLYHLQLMTWSECELSCIWFS